jgi:hypothetical protein
MVVCSDNGEHFLHNQQLKAAQFHCQLWPQ